MGLKYERVGAVISGGNRSNWHLASSTIYISVYQFMRQQRTTHLVVTVLDEHKNYSFWNQTKERQVLPVIGVE